MNHSGVNPYQVPATASVPRGHANFRLRPWFAVTLYLALAFDLFAVWKFGFQPFIASAWIFFLAISFAALRRKSAEIDLDDSGIRYLDLVHVVDVSWGRVERVIHRPSKTTIATDSPLAQVIVSRQHEDYEAIVQSVSELHPRFNIAVSDYNDSAS